MSNRGGPPPPPKRKNRQAVATYAAVGAGHNVARAVNVARGGDSVNSSLSSIASEDSIEVPHIASKICQDIYGVVPDSVVAKNIEINGDISFNRLLKIDGKFEGSLISRGDMIVGEKGLCIGNVTTLRQVIVDGGQILGNVIVDELVLRGSAIIKGDITCKFIEIIGNGCSIFGRLNVQPLAPELVDENDNIITELPPKVKLTLSI